MSEADFWTLIRNAAVYRDMNEELVMELYMEFKNVNSRKRERWLDTIHAQFCKDLRNADLPDWRQRRLKTNICTRCLGLCCRHFDPSGEPVEFELRVWIICFGLVAFGILGLSAWLAVGGLADPSGVAPIPGTNPSGPLEDCVLAADASGPLPPQCDAVRHSPAAMPKEESEEEKESWLENATEDGGTEVLNGSSNASAQNGTAEGPVSKPMKVGTWVFAYGALLLAMALAAYYGFTGLKHCWTLWQRNRAFRELTKDANAAKVPETTKATPKKAPKAAPSLGGPKAASSPTSKGPGTATGAATTPRAKPASTVTPRAPPSKAPAKMLWADMPVREDTLQDDTESWTKVKTRSAAAASQSQPETSNKSETAPSSARHEGTGEAATTKSAQLPPQPSLPPPQAPEEDAAKCEVAAAVSLGQDNYQASTEKEPPDSWESLASVTLSSVGEKHAGSGAGALAKCDVKLNAKGDAKSMARNDAKALIKGDAKSASAAGSTGALVRSPVAEAPPAGPPPPPPAAANTEAVPASEGQPPQQATRSTNADDDALSGQSRPRAVTGASSRSRLERLQGLQPNEAPPPPPPAAEDLADAGQAAAAPSPPKPKREEVECGDIVSASVAFNVAADMGYLPLRRGMRVVVRYIGDSSNEAEAGYLYGTCIVPVSQQDRHGWFPRWAIKPFLDEKARSQALASLAVDSECIVCQSRRREIRCKPCTHTPVCRDCWDLLKRLASGDDAVKPKCPLCRTYVESSQVVPHIRSVTAYS